MDHPNPHRTSWIRPGTIAAIAVVLAALVYIGYSMGVTRHMEGTATTGSSTQPRNPGAIQDQSASQNTSKPPLIDSNVPPAAAPAK